MNILNSHYKHIIWDWNGTLLDDVDIVINVMNSILQRRNLNLLTKDRYLDIFDFPVINYYSKLGFDFSMESFEKLSEEYISLYRNTYTTCALQKDAEKVINLIAASDKTQSILSASKHSALLEAVSLYKIENYFTKLLGLEDHYAVSKIENGKKLIAELSLKPEEVLLVGDTIHDYEVSKAIGCHCILVSCGHQSLNKLKSCSMPITNSLSEFIL